MWMLFNGLQYGIKIKNDLGGILSEVYYMFYTKDKFIFLSRNCHVIECAIKKIMTGLNFALDYNVNFIVGYTIILL